LKNYNNREGKVGQRVSTMHFRSDQSQRDVTESSRNGGAEQ